jgi:hypothetical protein
MHTAKTGQGIARGQAPAIGTLLVLQGPVGGQIGCLWDRKGFMMRDPEIQIGQYDKRNTGEGT